MTPNARASFEAEIEAACQRDDLEAATSKLIRGYGPEVLGFLVHATSDEALARDAFSWFCESVWKGLSRFRWESSLRTWCYVLARRSISRALRDRPGTRERPLETGQLENLAETVTTSALPIYRAQLAAGLAALRAELSQQERVLLTLRVDRELSWREIAQVVGDDDHATEAELDRTAAGLRKRYERAKARLHELAAQRGLAHR